jgi:hypothetical protein
MFGNDALKQILCDRNVNQERGRPGDFVAQMTFDFETPGKRSSKLRQLQLKTFGLKVVLSACDRSIRSLVSFSLSRAHGPRSNSQTRSLARRMLVGQQHKTLEARLGSNQ